MENRQEPFEVISTHSSNALYPDYVHLTSAKLFDLDVQLQHALRSHHPDMNLTVVPSNNCPLIWFAETGNATAQLDTTSEPVVRWREYVVGYSPRMQSGFVDSTFFARYNYKWGDEWFIVYTVAEGYMVLQYVLKEPGEGEDALSHCGKTDALLQAVAEAYSPPHVVWVFDGVWYGSVELYEEIKHASWDDVILDESMKRALTDITNSFFDSKDVYKRIGVPWKRGVIFYGPPGNGKTISLKAIMHTLYERSPAVPCLYVKSAPTTWSIEMVFELARALAPCLLAMEDIETIVNQDTRSYFFNEVDGLANNDGILMVATTNFLDRLDPGLSKRPSRFDRKYLFPLPGQHERTLYAEYWRQKLSRGESDITFPEKLCPAIADITEDFSFAFMQELFVATLLAIARDKSGDDDDYHDDDDDDDDSEDEGDTDSSMHASGTAAVPASYDATMLSRPSVFSTALLDMLEHLERDNAHKDLDKYRLWRVIKKQAKILREDMDSSRGGADGEAPPLLGHFRRGAADAGPSHGPRSHGIPAPRPRVAPYSPPRPPRFAAYNGPSPALLPQHRAGAMRGTANEKFVHSRNLFGKARSNGGNTASSR